MMSLFWLLKQFLRLKVRHVNGQVVISHPCGLTITRDSEALYLHYDGVLVQSSKVLSISDDGTKAWLKEQPSYYPNCSITDVNIPVKF
jgi:hypothetical protein